MELEAVHFIFIKKGLKQCFKDTNQILDRALDLLLQKIKEVLNEYKQFILQVDTVIESSNLIIKNRID